MGGVVVLPRLYILGRVELQLHSMNMQGSEGYYTRLQYARIVYKGREYELPIITGNAFKNYHSRAMLQAYIMEGGRQVHKEHFSDMYRISKKISHQKISP